MRLPWVSIKKLLWQYKRPSAFLFCSEKLGRSKGRLEANLGVCLFQECLTFVLVVDDEKVCNIHNSIQPENPSPFLVLMSMIGSYSLLSCIPFKVSSSNSSER